MPGGCRRDRHGYLHYLLSDRPIGKVMESSGECIILAEVTRLRDPINAWAVEKTARPSNKALPPAQQMGLL